MKVCLHMCGVGAESGSGGQTQWRTKLDPKDRKSFQDPRPGCTAYSLGQMFILNYKAIIWLLSFAYPAFLSVTWGSLCLTHRVAMRRVCLSLVLEEASWAQNGSASMTAIMGILSLSCSFFRMLFYWPQVCGWHSTECSLVSPTWISIYSFFFCVCMCTCMCMYGGIHVFILFIYLWVVSELLSSFWLYKIFNRWTISLAPVINSYVIPCVFLSVCSEFPGRS